MSDLKARIGDRQAPSKFEHVFIKQSSRRPSESSTHPTTASKSLLSRIGPVSPVRGTAARHDSLPLASSQMASRSTSTPTLPTSTLLCTPETKWRTAPEPVNLTSNAPVEGEIEQSVEASAIRSDNPPSNNGDSAGLPSNGAAERVYFSKTSNSRKSSISSTASTPQRHSSESEIVLDMLRLTPTTSIPPVPLEEPNEIQRTPYGTQIPLLREALLPVMVKNVQCRPSFDNTHEPEKIRDRLQEVLSDEFCGSLLEKMRSTQNQIQAVRSEEARSAAECQLVTSPTKSAGLDSLTRDSNFPVVQASTAASMPTKPVREVDITSIPTPPISAPLSEPPKAPRVMRLLEKQIQGLSMISPGSSAVLNQPCSRSRSNEIQPEDLDFRGRRRWSGGRDVPAGGSSIPSGSSTRTHQDNNLQPFGISIPMDPSFFATPPAGATRRKNEFPSPKRHRSTSRPTRSPVRRRSTERSKKDVDHIVRQGESGHLSQRYRSPSVTRRRSPSLPPRWTVAGPQTTRSPSPRRYRLRSRPPRFPSRRPYSPPAKRRRLSFSKPRSPPRTQRSVSRSRRSLSRRPLSPPVRRRTPVHLRTISREHHSPSPCRLDSPPVRLRSPLRRDRRLTPPRSPPPRPRLRRSPSPGLRSSQHLGRRSPSPRPIPAQRYLSHSPSTPYRPTPPPHRPYRHRLSRPPDKDHPEIIKLKSILHPPSLPPPPSPPWRQSTSSHPDNLRTPTPILDYDKTQPPSPADTMMVKREPDIEDFAAALRTSLSPAPQVPLDPPLPCHNVPGLWVVKMGHDQADVLVCEFEVDSETAKKWDLFSPSVSGNTAAKLSLQLRCLSKELVETVYETSLASSTAVDMAIELAKIKSEWPPQGSLIVQVNPAERYGKSWLPTHMAPPSPALDLTDSICEGLNVVQLIQLTDMADKIFVLQAMPLPHDEQDLAADLPTYWDIAAFDLPHGLSDSGTMPFVTIEVK